MVTVTMDTFDAGVMQLKRKIYATVMPIAGIGAIVVGWAGSREPGRATEIWWVPIVLGLVILLASAALLRRGSNVVRLERYVLIATCVAYAAALATATWSAWTVGGSEVTSLIRVGLWTPVVVAYAFLALRVEVGRVLAWIVWSAFAVAVASLFAFSGQVGPHAATTLLESLFVQLVAIVVIQGIVHVASTAIDRSDRMALLASNDSLTGLPNRRSAEEHLEREIVRASRYGRPLSLVWFDLDRFKSVNDDLGHDVGDHVLTSVGEAIRSGLREHDLLVRWGGEEFVIVLPEQDRRRAVRTAERLRERLAAHDMRLPDGRSVTASFGVAQHLPDEAPRDLLRRADMAMYEAKRAGRDRVHADPDAPSDAELRSAAAEGDADDDIADPERTTVTDDAHRSPNGTAPPSAT